MLVVYMGVEKVKKFGKDLGSKNKEKERGRK
jgi:hypothetical protein